MKINLPSSGSHQKNLGQWTTQKLEEKKLGTVVKLDDEKIKSIASETFQSLKNASPEPHLSKIFVLIMGVCGSGKSSQLLPMAIKNHGPGIKIATDDIRPKVAKAFRDMKDQNEYQEPLNTQVAARSASIELQAHALKAGYTVYATTVGYKPEHITQIADIAKKHGYECHLIGASIDPEVAVDRVNQRNIEIANSSDPILLERQPFQDPALSAAPKPGRTTANEVIDIIEKNPESYGFDSCTVYDTNVDKGAPPLLKSEWNSKLSSGV